MCKNREEAEQNSLLVYGDTNVAEPDFRPDGHYYHAQHDLEWVIYPDDGDPGVTGIRDGAKPLCVLAAENKPGLARMVPTPPAQPMGTEGLGTYPKFVNDFSSKNVFKNKPE